MKRFSILTAAVVLLGAASAFAETDYKALKVIQDIQKGTDNGNQIDVLRVRSSVVLPAGALDAADLAADSVGASEIAASAVGTAEIADGVILAADLNITNSGVVSAMVQSRGLRIAMGSVTNGQTITFPALFGGVPTILIGPEAAYTGAPFASSPTVSNFTAAGYSAGVAGGYLAVGIAP